MNQQASSLEATLLLLEASTAHAQQSDRHAAALSSQLTGAMLAKEDAQKAEAAAKASLTVGCAAIGAELEKFERYVFGTGVPLSAESITTVSHHGVDDAPEDETFTNVQCDERYSDTTDEVSLPCDADAHCTI